MTAWSLVVCKRLGFSEEEALSLGSFDLHLRLALSTTDPFTLSTIVHRCGFIRDLYQSELPLTVSTGFQANATSKAISLGIKPKPSEAQARASTLSIKEGEGWQQPHVVLMGRK